jgi:membrane protease subunit (stomatin/prohibitin family)
MLRRPMVVRGRPGLLGTMARTAVVAGTATATAGAVNRHSQNKQQAAQQQTVQAASPPAAPVCDPIAALKRLADLKAAGALTDAEFTAAKAKILGV